MLQHGHTLLTGGQTTNRLALAVWVYDSRSVVDPWQRDEVKAAIRLGELALVVPQDISGVQRVT